MKGFEIIISSPPDFKNLAVEIWHNDKMLAEINHESECLELEVFGTFSIDFDGFFSALQQARGRLIGNQS
ncbi:MAG: hypothetical protein ACK51A_12810 [Sphingobacteriia bacterium]|jgi:hypothetical protein